MHFIITSRGGEFLSWATPPCYVHIVVAIDTPLFFVETEKKKKKKGMEQVGLRHLLKNKKKKKLICPFFFTWQRP